MKVHFNNCGSIELIFYVFFFNHYSEDECEVQVQLPGTSTPQEPSLLSVDTASDLDGYG